MDLKTPSSGMADHNLYENIDFLSSKDVIKFVIQDRKDFEFALDKIKTFDLISKTQVYFSPVFEKLSPKELANWLLEVKLPIRLQIQLHKLLNLK
jgi:7-carboxy-7-deazaguanine synthase